MLGGPVDSASAHRLHTLTQGSPLFLRHLLAGEVSAGRFTPASGMWRWTSEPAISPELADLLQREMGGLPAGVQEVVLVAQDLAAYGRDIDAPGGLVELIDLLDDIDDLVRPRLLYLYPKEIKPNLEELDPENLTILGPFSEFVAAEAAQTPRAPSSVNSGS